MNLETLISSNAVISPLNIKSKKRALESLAETLAEMLAERLAESPTEETGSPADLSADSEESTEEVNAMEIFQLLLDRERLGSTSMGHGVALPHARTSLTDTAIAAFLKLDKGIDFDSPDQQATDLILALLVPEHYTDEHLKILAQLAALFSDEDFCQTIRNTDNINGIYENLIHWQSTSKAS
jgi:PTS system nitrogen regulatory IIA component